MYICTVEWILATASFYMEISFETQRQCKSSIRLNRDALFLHVHTQMQMLFPFWAAVSLCRKDDMFGLLPAERKQLSRCDRMKSTSGQQYNTFIVNILYLHNNQHHIINTFSFLSLSFFYTVNSFSVQMYTKFIQASQVPQKSNSCTVLKHNQISEGHAHACT